MFTTKHQRQLVHKLNLLGGFMYGNYYSTAARTKRRLWGCRSCIELKILCTDDFATEWTPINNTTAEAIIKDNQSLEKYDNTTA